MKGNTVLYIGADTAQYKPVLRGFRWWTNVNLVMPWVLSSMTFIAVLQFISWVIQFTEKKIENQPQIKIRNWSTSQPSSDIPLKSRKSVCLITCGFSIKKLYYF